MNKPKQLIVSFNKINIQHICSILPWIIIIVVSCIVMVLFMLSQIDFKSFCGPFLGFLIKSFLYFCTGTLVFCTVCVFFMKHVTPAAILSPRGIWVKHYGFIPWKNIDDISLYLMEGVKIFEVIGIQVKDPRPLLKQASWGGKCGLFWSKIFNYYHITLSNLETKNDDIINFARQYMTQV